MNESNSVWSSEWPRVCIECSECSEYFTHDTGTPHVCPPFNGYSDESRSGRNAVRAFLCKDDKDQMNRIENMLEKLLGKSL